MNNIEVNKALNKIISGIGEGISKLSFKAIIDNGKTELTSENVNLEVQENSDGKIIFEGKQE
jgi:hypothetical protein